MYKIDRSVDLDFLISKEVVQICIGSHDAVVKMTEGVEISVECDLFLADSDGLEVDVSPRDAALSSRLYRILGCTIESYSATSSTELVVAFFGGIKLKLVANDDGAEAFRIAGCNRDYIV